MLLSKLFLPLIKDLPADAKIKSHQLMLRTGMIKQSAAGIYSWLPLGFKIMKKIESIVREEQLQVLHDSKIVLEELNEEPNVDTEVIGPLIKSIDSKIPEDFAPLIEGLKLDKSKKNKKNKKSKKSKKSKKK